MDSVEIAKLRENAYRLNDFTKAQTASMNQMKAICRRFIMPSIEQKPKETEKQYFSRVTKEANKHFKLVEKFYKSLDLSGFTIKDNESRLMAMISADNEFSKIENPLTQGIAKNLFQFFLAFTSYDEPRKQIEDNIEELAKKLPISDFIKNTKGLGFRWVGILVANAGDLNNYSNPDKLKKRLGIAVIDGERQRKVKDKEAAQRHGYNPRRRSVLWVIGDVLTKQTDGKYRNIYLSRLRKEHENAISEGLIPAATTADSLNRWESSGLPSIPLVKKLEKGVHRGTGHMRARAKRYMEQQLVIHLWREWRSATA